MSLTDHDLVPGHELTHVKVEHRPVRGPGGRPVEGLHATWIILSNERELNSYTTEAVKDVILAFRRASADRASVAVVFTGSGNRAFCTGGNTREYAEVYAGRPQEYRQYMRLFNDMVSSILACDKPVICRVNGMRIAGGQEIGMACDFSVAQDLARFGQAGPRHGSAPDGGSTDFLPLFVGVERAMESCTLCETWSAHKAHRLGLLTEIVPALRVDGKLVPNPLVVTDRYIDGGKVVFGEPREGEELAHGKALLERGTVELGPLDEAVERLVTKLALTMPECLTKTLESVRKHKLQHWDKNRESNRAWLALNMMTEGRAGFRAFHHGKASREVDFLELRRRLASGEAWDDRLLAAILPEGARVIRAFDEEGGIVRLVLDAGKGNLLGVESVAALRAALAGAAADPATRAILIDPAGPAFCHGASVEEHVPPALEPMLRSLGALVVELVECPVPTVACVRGPCLGGGLELALGCTRIVASPDARLGQPEVKLGVFAPVASVLLPRRIGEAAAAAMLLTGDTMTGREALAIGLVDELADDPTAGARAFVARMSDLSASAIRFAHRSARAATARALWMELPALEQRYLSDLQETHDAREGIAAFLERRRPAWRNG